MKIQTTRFGEIDFPQEALLHFPEGVLGFPEDRDYLLLEHDRDNSPFKWLQSAQSPELAFIVVDPLLIVDRYPIMIDCDTARMIQVRDAAETAAMAILNIPQGDAIRMTANLKAPLLVNPEMRLGRQIIIGSQTFSVSEPVFPRLNERLDSMSRAGRGVMSDAEPSAATA